MSDWAPDSDDLPQEDATDVARVLTAHPVRLRLVETAHERAPEGSVVFRTLGVFEAATTGEGVPDDAPVLAQGALPEALFAALKTADVFAAPVPLLLVVRDDGGGLAGVLYAIVPRHKLERLERAGRLGAEPWLSSAEESEVDLSAEEGGDENTPAAPFALGAIVRFVEDRRHPESLADEAIDLMASLLVGRAMDADQKRIENLLKSL